MSVNESADPAAGGLSLIYRERQVSQETIHDLTANSVKQFLLVAYVMV
jgi:hypothetical protein